MSHDNEKEAGMNEELASLAQALRENRPVPEAEFSDRLDRAVADHFPPEWVDSTTSARNGHRVGSWGERFSRWLAGNRTLVPAFAGALGVLFVVAVVVVNASSGPNFGGTDSDSGPGSDGTTTNVYSSLGGEAEVVTDAGTSEDMAAPEDMAAQSSVMPQARSEARLDSAKTSSVEVAKPKGGRDVAREAKITLGTDPDGVQEVANRVVEVTDENKGIVMDSKVTDGEKGTAGASFSLLIPSGQIESAVADLSAIADLRSRSQELTDITAPVKRTEDAIADSEAKIKGLLGELEETFDEDARTAIEQEIRWERQEKRRAETRLNRLERRVDYTPVSLQVETGGDSSSDDVSTGWGISDALDDAGRLLGVAAGVAVLALAVAIPIGIVILIALALNRAWVRRARRRALADDE